MKDVSEISQTSIQAENTSKLTEYLPNCPIRVPHWWWYHHHLKPCLNPTGTDDLCDKWSRIWVVNNESDIDELISKAANKISLKAWVCSEGPGCIGGYNGHKEIFE